MVFTSYFVAEIGRNRFSHFFLNLATILFSTAYKYILVVPGEGVEPSLF
jgi:hypothetical protein